MKKNKEKFIVQTKVTLEEFQKAFKIIPRNYWVHILYVMIYEIIVFGLLILMGGGNFLTFLILEIIIFMCFLVYSRMNIDGIAKKYYRKLCKDKTRDSEYTLIFYDNYFKKESEHLTEKIEYQNIKKIIETDTNLYLRLDRKVIVINKDDCDLKLISFIREMDSLKYINKIGDNNKSKINSKVIKIFLDILFTITLLTIFLAMDSVSYANKIFNTPFGVWNRDLWVLWLWIPIPILSIVFGLKYHHREFDCSKNIIGGVIIILILLIGGSMCLFVNEINCSELSNYIDVMEMKLPDGGVCVDYSDGIENNNSENIIKGIRKDIYYYGNENKFLDFSENIKNSEKWILGSLMDESISVFINSFSRINNDNYYLIYNKTTGEYNTFPSNNNIENHIYTFIYDSNIKSIKIMDNYYIYEN